MDTQALGALLEQWLAPINAETPTGVDLRTDDSPLAPYHQLRDTRAQARNIERTALAEGDTNYFALEQWQSVYNQCSELLITQSKDLELVAWLIEALTRLYGFHGFAIGFSTAKQLVRQFGEKLHPQPDEEGLITQLGPLLGLCGYGNDGPLVSPLKSLPLTEAVSPGPLATWQCEQIFEVDRISDPKKKSNRLAQGVLTRKLLDEAVAASGDTFLLSCEKGITAAIEAFDQFQLILSDYANEDTQPTHKLVEVLTACQHMLTYIAGERLVHLNRATVNDQEQVFSDSNNDKTDTQRTANGHMEIESVEQVTIRNRQTALALLAAIGAFFRRTEPHSPISYSIDQLLRWSDMPLSLLIKELIPEDNARRQFQSLTGMLSEKDSA